MSVLFLLLLLLLFVPLSLFLTLRVCVKVHRGFRKSFPDVNIAHTPPTSPRCTSVYLSYTGAVLDTPFSGYMYVCACPQVLCFINYVIMLQIKCMYRRSNGKGKLRLGAT